MMRRLDLTDNERAILITALRRLVDFDPQSLSPQSQALKAILERLEPQKPIPYPILRASGEPVATRILPQPVSPWRIRTGVRYPATFSATTRSASRSLSSKMTPLGFL